MATHHKKNFQRNLEIASKYESGMTLAEVGAIYSISRERIRQIVSSLGYEKTDGGAAIRSFISIGDKVDSKRQKEAEKESRCFEKWGMTLTEYIAHVAIHGNTSVKSSPLDCYTQQRQNAKTRGIKWNFTFRDWWALWEESGKWSLRGRGTGYVMARHGDTGSYHPENVYICTQSQNSSDSYITKPHSVRFADSCKATGSGKGYYYAPTRSKTNPFYVQFRRKHLGSFPTAEAARDAYVMAVAGITPIKASRGYGGAAKKLDVEKVVAIRADSRKYKEIAAAFGVGTTTICRIKRRELWTHV